jgi:hypothetical protein
MAQPNSAEEHKLISSFEAVKKTLSNDEFADRLDKPLAYWALPNDRRLPLAFLGRSVGELLSTPFNELTATRGIGQKKISSLVKLLHRATNSDPPAVPYGIKELADEIENSNNEDEVIPACKFDPAMVSEALWVQWCETARRFHLNKEKLGRLAPSLQHLPTVIWDTPLGEYMNRSLAEIRQLRTHGEKRVRVVLEVFHAVHELLGEASDETHLSLTLVARFVPPVEAWLQAIANRLDLPTREQVANELAIPLLRQIRIDSGNTVYQLARDRLGIGVEPKSVRQQSAELDVTRARIYQLLEDCGKVMEVRWPVGRSYMARAMEQVETNARNHEGAQLFRNTRQLFFPDRVDKARGEKSMTLEDAAPSVD